VLRKSGLGSRRESLGVTPREDEWLLESSEETWIFKISIDNQRFSINATSHASLYICVVRRDGGSTIVCPQEVW